MPTASFRHPAPLPAQPRYPALPPSSGNKAGPPKPTLKISKVSDGIVLAWNMVTNTETRADLASYELYEYQEGSWPASTSLWNKVAEGEALHVPMGCTVTEFTNELDKYYYAVRAVDTFNWCGPFSDPVNIAFGEANYAYTPVGKPRHFQPIKS